MLSKSKIQNTTYCVVPFIKVFRKGRLMEIADQWLPRAEGGSTDELQTGMRRLCGGD